MSELKKVDVVLDKPCTVKGEQYAKGAKVSVTEHQAERMVKRQLTKGSK